jgi:hypothetical protein
MKKCLVVFVLAGAVFLSQRRNAHESRPDAQVPAKTKPAASPSPRPASEHDWAKHSLDHTQAVIEQVQKTRQENEQP